MIASITASSAPRARVRLVDHCVVGDTFDRLLALLAQNVVHAHDRVMDEGPVTALHDRSMGLDCLVRPVVRFPIEGLPPDLPFEAEHVVAVALQFVGHGSHLTEMSQGRELLQERLQIWGELERQREQREDPDLWRHPEHLMDGRATKLIGELAGVQKEKV